MPPELQNNDTRGSKGSEEWRHENPGRRRDSGLARQWDRQVEKAKGKNGTDKNPKHPLDQKKSSLS
ncbi:uncharacterized protein N7515_006398 [Penicillium bovifimosum]|uniref:Uncharacterized protein n=1 Tax=Penicillium bovifimosum TaxID=126998 RepID=A0A9W9GW54_9EURO|nr:uncharacterized protein N7515_006398 [Penicillium bovifimosum]KAJ5130359.1 hypothetical protein N7515_006398 [Penicillium bovifimosum]